MPETRFLSFDCEEYFPPAVPPACRFITIEAVLRERQIHATAAAVR
jgi:hypothetical protein